MLLIKDDSKVDREPTDEEIKSLCKPKIVNTKNRNLTATNGNLLKSSGKLINSKISSVKKFSSGITKNKIKEKGIIIKVKKHEVNQSAVEKENGSEVANGDSDEKNSEFNEDFIGQHISNEDGNGKVEKNAIVRNKLQIEIQNKESNNGNNSNIDLSECGEVFCQSSSQNLYQNKQMKK